MHYLEKFKYCPICGSAHFVENDFKSKKCEDCGFTYYFNAAAAVAAIIQNEKGELLMCRRACNPAKGTLDIIGGFVDPGESVTAAMVREMEEETGIIIHEEDLHFLFSIPNKYPYSELVIHSCDTFFAATISSQEVAKANDDVAECIWVKPEEIKLEEIGLTSIREAVRRYLSTL